MKEIEVSFIVPHKGVEFAIDGDGNTVYDSEGKATPIAVTLWIEQTFNDDVKKYQWLDKESKTEWRPRCTRKIGDNGSFGDAVTLNMITKRPHTVTMIRKHKLRYGVRYIFLVQKT